MPQAWYTIDPMAPLVFRSGRPFGAGSRDGANYPWPSSLAGLMRTQVMDAKGLDPRGNPAHKAELLALACGGPFPIECRAGNKPNEIWLPKPADAVLLKDEQSSGLAYHRLAPGRYKDGAGSDLPNGLLPITFTDEGLKGKPQPGPAWWPLAEWLRWAEGKQVDVTGIVARCESQPWQVAQRTHVGIDRDALAAADGALFQTEGLDFAPRRRETNGRPEGWQDERFRLAAIGPIDLDARAVTFGGERRMSWLAPHAGNPLPAPADWANQLARGFALTLVTPALFTEGWRPAWLDAKLEGEVPGISGLRVRLRAAAVERWQGISGWDLVAWAPRATRKAVTAGATYWFEILAGNEAQLAKLWLASISDREQDRRDGFGLALPRPWNATLYGDHA